MARTTAKRVSASSSNGHCAPVLAAAFCFYYYYAPMK